MKIPMLLFEIQSLGPRFAISRYAMSFLGLFLIAFFLDKFLVDDEKKNIIEKFQ